MLMMQDEAGAKFDPLFKPLSTTSPFKLGCTACAALTTQKTTIDSIADVSDSLKGALPCIGPCVTSIQYDLV